VAKVLMLAVIFSVVQAAPPVPRQTPDGTASKNNSENSIPTDNQSNANAPIPAAKNTPTNTTQNGSKPDAAKDKSDPVTVNIASDVRIKRDFWDYAAIAGGLLIALGTLVLAGIAWIQAKAALKSAEAVVKSERAWMLVEDFGLKYFVAIEHQQTLRNYATINFRNYGKTVAKLTAWKFGLYLTDAIEEPPSRAYDLNGLYFNPYFQPQEKPISYPAYLEDVQPIIRQRDYDAVVAETPNPTKMLWLCGVIKYEDVFDPDVRHETVICYRLGGWYKGREPYFKPVLNDYNRAT
jgi:hypothetical protein